MPKLKRYRTLLNRKNARVLAAFLLCWTICWWLLRPDVSLLSPEGFRQGVAGLGWLGPLVYMGILALSVVISPIPGALLAVVAGAMWGAIPAGIYSVTGGFLGSLIAYFVGYHLGRSAIKFLTGKIIYFSKKRGEIYLSWLIFLTRLIPVLSFDLISYGAGIAGLSLPRYAVATLLGMIPSTFLLTYMGEAFTLGMPLKLMVFLVFFIILFGLPWLIQRHNWFGIRDIVQVK